MTFAAKIAIRFLKSGKGQTILIALGIAIGVSVQIFIGLLIQGLQQSLIERTIGNSPQITITSEENNKLIDNWQDKIKKITASGLAIENISVSADSPGFVKFDDKTEPVLVRGVIPDKADTIYNIKKSISEGTVPLKDYEILVGKELKETLGLQIDDVVQIYDAQGNNESFKIAGFYDLKVSSINKSWLFVNLDSSQKLFSFNDKITSIEIQVEKSKVFEAIDIAYSISEVLSDNSLKVDNWQSQNEQLLSGLRGQSISSIMIQIFVLVSVLLGIASVLAITVMQKSKQIGILKAMGVKDFTSSLIFLFEGLFLGITGALMGIVLGIALIVMFTKFALNPDGTPVVEIYMNYWFIGFSGIIAVVSAVAASLIPARKSSKLSPIEVIRNG